MCCTLVPKYARLSLKVLPVPAFHIGDVPSCCHLAKVGHAVSVLQATAIKDIPILMHWMALTVWKIILQLFDSRSAHTRCGHIAEAWAGSWHLAVHMWLEATRRGANNARLVCPLFQENEVRL